jgi:uncharacterized protein YjdB
MFMKRSLQILIVLFLTIATMQNRVMAQIGTSCLNPITLTTTSQITQSGNDTIDYYKYTAQMDGQIQISFCNSSSSVSPYINYNDILIGDCNTYNNNWYQLACEGNPNQQIYTLRNTVKGTDYYFAINNNSGVTFMWTLIESSTPASLKISSQSQTIMLGTQIVLSAIASPTNADQSVQWSSSNTTVATVDTKGTVYGYSIGSAFITAQSIFNPNVLDSIYITVTNLPINLGTISLTPTPLSNMFVGDSQSIQAIVTTSGGIKDSSVSWSSSNDTIVTVTNGLLQAIQTGYATITCTSLLDTTIHTSFPINVSVNTIKPTSLKITSTIQTIQVGMQSYVSAMVSPINADQSVIWNSSNSAVASIDSKGNINGMSIGTAVISATSSNYPTIRDSIFITVKSQTTTLGSISLMPTPLTMMNVGNSQLIQAIVTTSTGIKDSSVSWTTSNNMIVAVANGMVQAVQPGDAIITCTSILDTSIHTSFTITVSANTNQPTSLKITSSIQTIQVGMQTIFSASVYPISTDQSVIWKSSNPAIAGVDSKGNVNGLSLGQAVISATSTNYPTIRDSIFVTVTNQSTTTGTISFTPNPMNVMSVGNIQMIKAIVTPTTGTIDSTVSWYSSDSMVVAVNNGTVKAKNPGIATITCTSMLYPSIHSSFTISVTSTSIQPNSLKISFTTQTIQIGMQSYYSAIVSPNTADQSVIWKSSNPSIAPITSNGYVTGMGIGTSVISATSANYPTIRDSILVTITNQTSTGTITFVPTPTTTMAVGGIQTIKAIISMSTGVTDSSVTWFSSDTNILKVTNGTIIAYSQGSAIITVKSIQYPTIQSSVQITVGSIPVMPTSLKISSAAQSIPIGAQTVMTAMILPINADQSVLWKSSNPGIASVDSKGNIYGMSIGTSVISATSSNYPTIRDSILITITKQTSNSGTISFMPAPMTIMSIGSNQIIKAIVNDTTGTIDSLVTWYSSDSSIVAVIANGTSGTIKAYKTGNVTITCISKQNATIQSSFPISVSSNTNLPISIQITPSSQTISVGTQLYLSAMVSPTNADQYVIWRSSNPSVANIDSNGYVYGYTIGNTIITATARSNANVVASASINVTNQTTKLGTITFSPAPMNLMNIGDIQTIQAIVTTSTGSTNTSVIWYSADTSIVIVSNGSIKAIRPGTVNISCISSIDPSISTSFPITVVSTTVQPLTIAIMPVAVQTIMVGTQTYLTAMVSPTNADQSVIWKSLNPAIATVDAKGNVYGLTGGTAIIIATSNSNPNVMASISVVVSNQTTGSGSISFMPTPMSLMTIGSTQSIQAFVTMSTGTNTAVLWTSTDSSIASVSNGMIKALRPGNAIIACISSLNPTILATFPITVEAVNGTTTTISLSPSGSQSLVLGTKMIFNAMILPNTTNQSVSWTSSNQFIATVDGNGNVFGNSIGTAVITATVNNMANVSTSVMVNVIPPMGNMSISFSPSPSTVMSVGNSQMMTVVVFTPTGTDNSVSWSSSDPSIASVSQTGDVIALKPGNVKITATSIQYPTLTAITALNIIAPTSSIPNGNFELWSANTVDYPQSYQYNSNIDNFYKRDLPIANVLQTTDSYSGKSALQLSTIQSGIDTLFAYVINTNPNDGGPTTWKGGVPFNQIPKGIRGYYKYNTSADSATLIIGFRKDGANIGTYIYTIGGIHSKYTPFDFTFPGLTTAPDSVILGILSCKLSTNGSGSNAQPKGLPGSILVIDSVSFTGVTSQPALLNGDFETWQSQTISNPQAWYIQGGGSYGQGYKKITDAAQGSYAIELTTFESQDQNGFKRAQSAMISTGYWPNNCNGNCIEHGGFPYSRANDTLAFYYKYTPAHPNDSAWINLNFKKNGFQFDGRGFAIKASATPSTYSYVEFPINLSQYPDSVMINIQSSNWQDTSLSFVGADLKIDAIHFKSQTLAVSDSSLSVSTNSINVSSGLNTTPVLVNGTVSWKASSNQSWLSITPGSAGAGNGVIYITVQPNTGISRTGVITINGGGLASRTIQVTQDAFVSSLSLSESSIILVADKSTTSVDITSNTTWIANSSVTWLQLTPVNSTTGNGTLSLTASANPNSATRTATITVIGSGVATQTITIIQEGNNNTITNPPVAVQRMTILDGNQNLQVGQSFIFHAQISPANATSQQYNWYYINALDTTQKGALSSSTASTLTYTPTQTGIYYLYAFSSEFYTTTTGKQIYYHDSVKVSITQKTAVNGIMVNVDSLNIKVGYSDNSAIASILPVTATNKAIRWYSNNTSIAMVDSLGIITGISAGNALITVYSVENTSISKSFTVHIIAPLANKTILSKAIVDADLILANITSSQIGTNTGQYSAALLVALQQQDSLSKYVYSIPDVGQLYIDNSSASLINAMLNFKNSKVGAILINSITLSPSIIKLNIASQALLSVSILPANATNNQLNWQTSDPTVATVNSNGLVTAVGSGLAIITVSSTDGSNISASSTIQITVPVVSINIPQTIGIQVGSSTVIAAYVKPINATNTGIKWSSSDTTIAKVDAFGIVTALKAGSAKILAQSIDGQITAVCIANISTGEIKMTSITMPDTIHLLIGSSQQIQAIVTPYNATNQYLYWASSNPASLAIDYQGVAKALSVDTVKVYAYNQDKSIKDSTTVYIGASLPPVTLPIQPITVKTGTTNIKVALNSLVSDVQTSINNLTYIPAANSNFTVTVVGDSLVITPVTPQIPVNGSITINVADQNNQSTIVTLPVIISSAQNKAPVLSPIPSQSIIVGGTFIPYSLAQFVTDDYTKPTDIVWTVAKNANYQTAISYSVLTVQPTNSSWTGVDSLLLTATDQGGLSKSIFVYYTVSNKANQPPVLSQIPVQTQTSTTTFQPLVLGNYVSDDYTPNAYIAWNVSQSNKVSVSIVNGKAYFTVLDKNWKGSEIITFTVTDQGGLSTQEKVILNQEAPIDQITWSGKPIVSFIAERTIVSKKESVYFHGSITGNYSLGLAWAFPNGSPNQSNDLNPIINYAKPGKYDVMLIAENTIGDDTAQIANYISVIGITTPDTTICKGSSITLSVSDNSLTKYIWSTGETTASITVSPTVDTKYSVTAQYGLTNYYDTVTITLSKPVNLGNDTAICAGNSLSLTVPGYASYVWNGSGSLNSNSFTVSSAQKVSIETKDAFGCVSKDTIAVSLNALPTVNLGSDRNVCLNVKDSLNAGAGFSYAWSDGSKNQSLALMADGTYSVTITDINGCKASDTATITILKPYAEPLGVATVITNSKIVLAWNRTSNKNTASYEVLRESTAAGVFDIIGKKAFNDDSYVVDSNVNAISKQYTYKLKTIDNCKDTAESIVHKTMVLSASYSQSQKANNLIWKGYEGISSLKLSTYFIYRNGVKIDSIAASSTNGDNIYNDTIGVVGDKYFIAYKLPDSIITTKVKSDSGPYSQSLSNLAESQLTAISINELNAHVIAYPNPSSGYFSLFIVSKKPGNFKVTINNALGETVFETQTGLTAEKLVNIQASGLANGLYILKVEAQGTFISKQIMINK